MVRRFIYFLTIAIVLVALLNLVYIFTILQEKNIYRSQDQFDANLDKTILFHGDSHAARAINPAFINNSFNYAVPSQTYEQTYFKVRSALNVSDASVYVLPLDMHSFSNYRKQSYYEMHFWRKHLSLDELSLASGYSVSQTIIYTYVPLVGRGKELFSFFIHEKTPVIMGWQKNNKSFLGISDKDAVALERVKSHLTNPYDEVQYRAFLDTLNLLHENNKKIILISYPVSPQYEEAVKKIAPVSRELFFKNVFDDIEIPFEFYDFSLKYTNLSLFSDEDHLNAEGARLFSQDIEKIILLNREVEDVI